jgi:hypothetical protein
MKSTILRLTASLILVLALAVAYSASYTDTAEAKGPPNKEKGGPNLFWD